ncbi:MAG: methyl-accepting chemotaxis protein [Spirochaetes bacterium]|nr:methyl-accepting chemotaxis protein [Spirochaetota bacterium]
MSDSGFNAYIYELSHRWIKIVLVIGAILVPGFSFLDYVMVPRELFFAFLGLRIGSSAIIMLQYLVARVTRPGPYTLAHGYIMTLATGIPIAIMTVLLGGFTSPYYAGLNLVIIGATLFLPWRYIHTALNGLIVVAIYVLFNLVFGPAPDILSMVNNLFFMLSTVILVVGVSFLRYRLTLDEFRLRRELSGAQVEEIRELARLAQIVASGDLSVRVETRSSDTAGLLESSFDTMVRHLHDMVRQISEIASSVNIFGGEIRKNADDMMTGAREQMEQTESSTAIIREMNRVILENAKKSDSIDGMAAEAARTATKSGAFIDDAVASMGRIVAVVRQSAGQVQSLRDSSRRIGEIIASIEDIADKTNLLSLNAAIEAARAGEHGRGFAIVAQEVSKLADVTAKATGEISSMISSISEEIQSASSSMEDTSREVDSSSALIKKMHDSMRDIVSISESLRLMIGQMAEGNRGQTAAAEKADAAISAVSAITVHLTGWIENISGTIEKLSALTDNLDATVKHFKLN